MKIKNKKNTKKYFYILGVILLLAVLIFLTKQWWYLDTEYSTPQNTVDTVQKPQKQSTSDKKEQPSTTKPPEKTETEEQKSEQNTPKTENPSSADQPSKTASFPVSTKEYVITKISNDQYSIRLNAILNSPEQYDQYEKELRLFKTKALEYLGSRIGSLENITITWTPANAEAL